MEVDINRPVGLNYEYVILSDLFLLPKMISRNTVYITFSLVSGNML
jgi:hypothetical protein